MIRKIFHARFIFVEEFQFFCFFVVVFFVIILNEITKFIRNAEKKIQSEQNSFSKKNSNNVELSHFDVFSSSLSFNHSKLKNQKNLNSFDFFFIVKYECKNDVYSN